MCGCELIFVTSIAKILDISNSPILLNVDKYCLPLLITKNTRYMFIIAAMAVMLVGATALAR